MEKEDIGPLTNELLKVLYAQFIREDILNNTDASQMKYHQYLPTDTEYQTILSGFDCKNFDELKRKLIIMDMYEFLRKMVVEFHETLTWGKKITESLSEETIDELSIRLYIKWAICGNYLGQYHKETHSYFDTINTRLQSYEVSDQAKSNEPFPANELFIILCNLFSCHAAHISYKPTCTSVKVIRTTHLYDTFDLRIIGITKTKDESTKLVKLFLDRFINAHTR